ncbi:MAG: hypothetical protein INR71_01905, partial [Terriglobus roseus]|nr:hypothetical protein [Terriglobus roseus]
GGAAGASRRGSEGFEGMRRRLEGEASASGADAGARDEGRRRTLGGLLVEQFGGR